MGGTITLLQTDLPAGCQTTVRRAINAKHTYYQKVTTNQETGEVITLYNIYCPMFCLQYEGRSYYILYDASLNCDSQIFEYLNYYLDDKSPNTVRSYAAALRLLLCFCGLTGYTYDTMDAKAVKELQRFLQGVSFADTNDDLVMRSNNSINTMIGIYRSFFDAQDIECDALFRQKNLHNWDNNSSLKKEKKAVYASNLPSKKVNNTVPKYIRPSEFLDMYRLAEARGDRTAMLLMHLMYFYGLRIGECLGLTTEDICEPNSKGVAKLYLRNRMSDVGSEQSAKGLMHPVSPAQYASSEYLMSRHKIVLTRQTYAMLTDYVEDMHGDAMDKHPDIYDMAVADIVSVRNKPDENHYVILNSLGGRMTGDTWNKRLRGYFEAAGLKVDTGGRYANLNHRYRHGFAMLNVRYRDHPVSALELQKMMRHKSITSTMIYYNPTEEDEAQIKAEFVADIQAMMPNLLERG